MTIAPVSQPSCTLSTYPKTENLFSRDKETGKCRALLRRPHFAAINRWRLTEKIDGMNIRIVLLPNNDLFLGGKTDRAQLPPKLVEYILDSLDMDTFIRFMDSGKHERDVPITIYGEGYGPGIQKGGGYCPDPRFRGFDLGLGETIGDHGFATELIEAVGLKMAPDLGLFTLHGAIQRAYVDRGDPAVSRVALLEMGADHYPWEGIVAVSEPNLYDAHRNRIKFKLKLRDIVGSPALMDLIRDIPLGYGTRIPVSDEKC